MKLVFITHSFILTWIILIICYDLQFTKYFLISTPLLLSSNLFISYFILSLHGPKLPHDYRLPSYSVLDGTLLMLLLFWIKHILHKILPISIQIKWLISYWFRSVFYLSPLTFEKQWFINKRCWSLIN